jgi:FtsP/CotA-like multicopper oxidase with cupredoxin domain
VKSILMRVGAIGAAAIAMLSTANAQIPFDKFNADPTAANAAFPLQNPNGPSGVNYQVNYPFPRQCLADPLNVALFPRLAPCAVAGTSFECTAGLPARTAGGWATCGAAIPFFPLQPIAPNSVATLAAPVATPKFVWEVLNPPDYSPDTTSFPGAHYYELGVHESWGFEVLADLGAFPDPLIGRCSISGATCYAKNPLPLGCGGCNEVFPKAPPVPNGMQWTGLTCNAPTGCTCPADLAPAFKAAYCSFKAVGAVQPLIPYGYPLYTPVWGVGQINMGGTLGVTLPATGSPWSQNQYIATWPSISVRANKGTPVVVKWVNEFPNNHVLCPHPEAADWPCGIDRTFMGVKATIDPALATGGILPDGVNKFGSPQQPDNSWVTHLHGGEIPPSTDGFAEKWFGTTVTGPLYTPNLAGQLVNPPFENPSAIALKRPNGNFDTYSYPMVQEEATIWFHDHTLGKTHHNVIAGPAGFFPVKEPLKHGGLALAPGTTNVAVASGVCPAGATGCTTDYTWLDPVTEPRGAFGIPMYDLFLAIQDRAFNDDGSFNFANGNAQVPIVAGTPACTAAVALNPAFVCSVAGTTAVTPGVNPQVHPLWVPEYFGDHALVNGVIWPKKSTEPGWYRLRLVDGSDSRCWTLGFQQSALPPAPGAAVTYNVPFYVLANDQGYMKNPVRAPANRITMCPGERYELLVNFGALPGLAVGAAGSVWMVNNAMAPFPVGIAPQTVGGAFAEMNVIMKFDVNPVYGPGIKSCGLTQRVGRVTTPLAPPVLTWDPLNMATNLLKSAGAVGGIPAGNYANICMPANPALQLDASYVDLRPAAPAVPGPLTFPAGTIVRQVYLNEKVDSVTLAPLGMQLNGVPFEYKVTETPKQGTKEVWQFVNLTVDAHPMHPHLVRHQVVARQNFNVGAYKARLCGGTTCMPGPAPGGEMVVIPDVTVNLTGTPTLVTAAAVDGGYKDASQVPPAKVTTIIADWTPRWPGAGTVAFPAGTPTAPGTAGCPNGTKGCAAPFMYETVTSGPYVWHCHINSHEDSEMMRTSLVVP